MEREGCCAEQRVILVHVLVLRRDWRRLSSNFILSSCCSRRLVQLFFMTCGRYRRDGLLLESGQILSQASVRQYVAFNVFYERRIILMLCAIVYAIVGHRLFGAISPDKFGTFTDSLYTVTPLSQPLLECS